jgi:large subunit ribosomal protein L19
MANNIISAVNIEERKNLAIKPGDTVRVWQKIQEKGKTRLQAFEGLVLARKHGTEAGATFTVRKVIDSVGVEKIFPLYTPMIDKIDLLRRSKVRRAKLYFVREKAAKEIRRQMRRMLAIDKDQNTDTKHTASIKAELEGKEEAKA